MRADDADAYLVRKHELQEAVRGHTAETEAKIMALRTELAETLKPLEEELDDIDVALERYHREVRERDDSIKTIELPNGVLASRNQQPRWVYTDEDAFVAWAMDAHPELAPQPDPPKPRPDKNLVKKTLSAEWAPGTLPGTAVPVVDPDTSEVVPGLHVEVPDADYEANPG